MNLKLLGWSDHWDTVLSEQSKNTESVCVARITAAHRGMYIAVSGQGEINAYLSGKFHHTVISEFEYPTVGDWVVLGPEFVDETDNKAALLETVLARKSKISRVAVGKASSVQLIAANVDFAFIVTSANADLNLKRLQRYLLVVRDGGVIPVIVVSKSDLHSEDPEYVSELVANLREEFEDVDVVVTSSESGEGIDSLRTYFKQGSTSVFIGSSGVGKSTLVNSLLGEDVQSTREIREGDDKGRHTTTSREMFFLPDAGMIIDTPGVREIQVFGDNESVQVIFKKIDELTRQCKFSDCTHSNEPKCAIRDALEKDLISEEDMNSYHKLLREMQHANAKMDKVQASNTKKKWKEINVNYRKRKKFEGR